MREILFRGKDFNGKWLYGDLINLTDEIKQICDHTQLEHAHSVNPDTVGQYTGLTDEAGKKIFEGDIVKIKLGDITKRGIVAYSERAARVGIIENGNIVNFSFMQQPLIKQCSITVIGNYHDNPELLEEKK